MSDVAAVEATHDVSSERISRKCPHALQINSCRCRGNHHGHSYDFQFQSERNEAGGRITSNLKPLQKNMFGHVCLNRLGLRPFGRSSSSTEAPLTLILHAALQSRIPPQRCPACAALLLNLPHPVHCQFINSSVRFCLSPLVLMIVFSRLSRFSLDRCALQRSPGRQCQAAGKLGGRVRPFGKAQAYKIETRKS